MLGESDPPLQVTVTGWAPVYPLAQDKAGRERTRVEREGEGEAGKERIGEKRGRKHQSERGKGTT